jgi:DNA invertase Pin-like site-specific DNA recombinase
MAGILIGYARTSTAEQIAGLEAQVRDLKSAGCKKLFREQASSTAGRDQLEATIDYIREGDTLVVTKLDRLARSTLHLWEIVKRLEAKGASLRILHLGGAAFAQFEREMISERQREGIAKAKAAGKDKGRKPTARAKAGEAVRLIQERKRVSEVAEVLGIGRASVYRALEGAR